MFLWKLTFSRKQSVIIVRSSKKEHHHTCDHTCFLLKIHHCFYLSQPSLTWEQQHLTWEQISLLDPYLGNLFTRYPFAHELYLRFTWVSCGGWLLVRMFFALLEIACKGWLCGFFVHVLYLSVLVRVCHLWGFWAARCNYLRIWLTCYKKKFVLELYLGRTCEGICLTLFGLLSSLWVDNLMAGVAAMQVHWLKSCSTWLSTMQAIYLG